MLRDEKPAESATNGSPRSASWAHAFDGHGKRIWRQLGQNDHEKSRQAGYAAAIIVNVILLVIAHNILNWRVPYLTAAFADVLWAIDLSLGATIIANALYLDYDAPWFRNLTQIVLNAFALVVGYLLFAVFPFDFGSAFANSIAHLALVGVMLGLAVALIVEIVVWIVDETRHVLSW